MQAALLFTDNETNAERLFGIHDPEHHAKDAFHEYVVHGRKSAVNAAQVGTKAAPYYELEIPAGGEVQLRFRLSAAEPETEPFGSTLRSSFHRSPRRSRRFLRGADERQDVA